MDFNQLLNALATNGIGAACAAAVLWFAWYRETKTIPKMIDAFAAIETQAIASFEARNSKTMDTFAMIIKEERQICQKWHEEDRGLLQDVLSDLREQRHHLANMANAVGLRQLAEEMKKQAEGK